MQEKPKIAIVPIGHATYFKQFANLSEELKQKSAAFAAYFSSNVSVIITEYIDTIDKAYSAVKELLTKDVDAVFILLTTYSPSAIIAPFALYLYVPQILVGIQPLDQLDYENCTTYLQLANDDICAMPEITGVYIRLGKQMPPCIIASSKQKEQISKEVRCWERAIIAKASFKYAKIGYLGHTYEGMYDMHTDPTAFSAAFKSHVQMLEMCELAKYVEQVSDSQLKDKVSEIRNLFEIKEPSVDPITDYVLDSDLELSARIACALDRMVESNGLVALAYYYKGEANIYEDIGANMIIGNTLLTSKGIPLAGEADLKTVAALLIMNRIGGGGTFAELHPFDINRNCVLIGHDGPHNIAISEGNPILRKLKKYHGKAGCGIGVEFSIKTGLVTMLSISINAAGKFKMIAAVGEAVAGRIPQTGNTNTLVNFNMPITDFLKRWCEAGPTHHIALGAGDCLREISHFARMLNLDIEIIS